MDDGTSETLQATFETRDPSWTAFSGGKPSDHRFVAVQGGTAEGRNAAALGWVMASPATSRPVYAGVVEVSVFRRPGGLGEGIGTALLRRRDVSTGGSGP